MSRIEHINGIPYRLADDDTPTPMCSEPGCPHTSEGACSCGCGKEACEAHGRFCEEHGWVWHRCAEPISINGDEYFLCHMDAREIEKCREAA